MRNLLILLQVLLLSCNNSKEESDKKSKEIAELKEHQLDSLNEKAISDLNSKFNAESDWKKTFIYEYQQTFIDSNNLISFKGEIIDILKIDTSYFLKVGDINFFTNFVAELSFDNKTFSELKKLLNSGKKEKNGCFIFKLTRITSSDIKVKVNIDEVGEDHVYTSLYYDLDPSERLYIFKGKLIDFYLEEKK